MSTSGSFSPPAQPECSYAPDMSLAAALALRAAGTLNPNCIVRVPGPALGTAAVPTFVELNPVSPTELGLTGRLTSSLDNSSWACLFDPDQGAAGTFLEVRDNAGNVVRDPDGSVIAQFPFGNADVTDNLVVEGTLTGWGTLPAGFTVRGNTLTTATVDLTGTAAGGAFTENTVISATVNVPGTNAGTVFFRDCSLTDQATVTVNKPGQQFFMNGSRVRGGTVSVTGPSPFSSTRDDLTNPNWSDAGGVAVTSNWSSTNNVGGGTVTRAAGHDFAVLLTNSTLYGTVNIGASARAVNITSSHYLSGTATVNGGALNITSSTMRTATFTMSGTRGLAFSDCDVHQLQSFTQARTGGTGQDSFFQCVLQRATVSLTGAVDPGTNQTIMNVCTVLMSTVNVADPVGTGTVVLQSTEVTGQSTLNVQAGALLHDRCRIAAGAVLNTGAFAAQSGVIEGAFTVTSTATNNNRRVDKSYSDWL